jgi:chromosome segregation ATPase
MAEKVLKIKTLSEVAEAISGLTDLQGSLKGVGTAAFEAAGKSKGEWKALEAELAKTTGTAKGMAEQAFKVESALNAMGRAGSTSQLESGLVKAKVELNAFKAKIDEVRAAGGTIDDGMTSSLKVMEASVEAGKSKLNGLKDAASRARAELGLLGPEGNRAAAGVGAVGTASRGAATATGALSQQTTGAAKAIMAASGAVGPYGELLSQLQQSSTGTAASLAAMAFKFVSVAAAAKIGWEAGRKLDEEFKKMGIDLAEPESMLRKLEAALRQTPEAADDASVSIGKVVSGTAALEKGIANIPGPLKEFALGLIDVAKGAREAEPAFKNLAADIDLTDERLTEHTKGLAGQTVARRALLDEVKKTSGALQDALPGWKSTAERAKDLADQIQAVDAKFRSFEKTGVDLRKELEANPVPLQKFIEVLKEGKVSFDELPPSIQKAIAILKEQEAAANGVAAATREATTAIKEMNTVSGESVTVPIFDLAEKADGTLRTLKLISAELGNLQGVSSGATSALHKLAGGFGAVAAASNAAAGGGGGGEQTGAPVTVPIEG